LAVWRGLRVSGSDRFFDRGESRELRRALEKEGIVILPQDGSGVSGAETVVSSAAVEADIPDVAEARKMGVSVVSRAAFLREWGRPYRRVAVAGTNGKSTTTAMLAWILHRLGRDPTVVLGAEPRGDWGGEGNARAGGSDLFCFEADESDGELDSYRPEVGAVTNISEDHFCLDDLVGIFQRFAASVTETLVVNRDSSPCRALFRHARSCTTFSLEGEGDYNASEVELKPAGSRFRWNEIPCFISLPGVHNVADALCALTVAAVLGADPRSAADALASFPGLGRRLEVVGYSGGTAVLDDYAHNPAKIAASLAAARLLKKHLAVVYRPHGFTPLARFLAGYARAFSAGLGPEDLLVLLPVFYAGGTAAEGKGSRDLAVGITGGCRVLLADDLDEAAAAVEQALRPETAVIFMGARDPDLSSGARRFLSSLRDRGGEG